MKKFLVLAFFIILSACTSNRILYTNEKGQTVYQADCGGNLKTLNMGDCLRLAGKTCPMGFDVIVANEQANGFLNGNQIFGNVDTNTNINAQAGIFPNGASAQGFGKSQTSFNTSAFGGGAFSYSRYLIYTCK
ncbi:MAG: hypothetical protein J6Y53_03870 [Alphaproteobacteria bacterium]|nr:hypothetical protein [Alphaproteobacteria bacterium]